MRQDVDRVFVVDQRVEAVAGGVLDLELVADAIGQPGVVARIAAQSLQLAEQHGVASRKGIDAQVIFGVDRAAVSQHDAHAGQSPVTVLSRAAAHAGGVVGSDATDLGGANGSGVRADLHAEGGETAIHFTADDAGADFHLAGVRVLFVGGKTFADQGEDAIGDGLPG